MAAWTPSTDRLSGHCWLIILIHLPLQAGSRLKGHDPYSEKRFIAKCYKPTNVFYEQRVTCPWVSFVMMQPIFPALVQPCRTFIWWPQNNRCRWLNSWSTSADTMPKSGVSGITRCIIALRLVMWTCELIQQVDCGKPLQWSSIIRFSPGLNMWKPNSL
jgi:hypothetical protein